LQKASKKEPGAANPEPQKSKFSASESAVGATPTGKTIYVGPRGGLYHYSESGKKVYERRRR
jgi:hypothetical protein